MIQRRWLSSSPALLLIPDTGKQTVNGNHTAALALALHAQDVTNYIVERAEHGEGNADSLGILRLYVIQLVIAFGL